jgi:phospholipase C
MRNPKLLLALLTVLLSACAQAQSASTSSAGVAPDVLDTAVRGAAAGKPARKVPPGASRLLLGNGTIEHVVIIFQENRSTDNLFNGLPGADTVTSGTNSAGDTIKMKSAPLTAPWDLDHSHPSFNTEFDGGRMDGFNLDRSSCTNHKKTCIPTDLRAYAYVPQQDEKPYFTMAESYAFGDKMFATQAGPSFPAHQYILTGTSTVSQSSTLRASENPLNPLQKFTGGCDSPSGSLVMLIDENGTEDQQVYPCFERPALTDLLGAKGLTWRYYQAHPGPGLWNAPDAIKHIREGSQYSTEVVSPPSQVLTDIGSGNLATVVWVTPTAKASDHAGLTNGTGPDWVASVVNAIGESSYWNNTVIFVTWDDWGGWYDHVTPQQYNSYELGFRVPLIAIGPYAKQGYVSHVQHEFGSILKFTEKAFGLGSLGATDVRADDLSDCFTFSGKPRAFTPIQTAHDRSYFLRQPMSYVDPDDE